MHVLLHSVPRTEQTQTPPSWGLHSRTVALRVYMHHSRRTIGIGTQENNEVGPLSHVPYKKLTQTGWQTYL